MPGFFCEKLTVGATAHLVEFDQWPPATRRPEYFMVATSLKQVVLEQTNIVVSARTNLLCRTCTPVAPGWNKR